MTFQESSKTLNDFYNEHFKRLHKQFCINLNAIKENFQKLFVERLQKECTCANLEIERLSQLFLQNSQYQSKRIESKKLFQIETYNNFTNFNSYINTQIFNLYNKNKTQKIKTESLDSSSCNDLTTIESAVKSDLETKTNQSKTQQNCAFCFNKSSPSSPLKNNQQQKALLKCKGCDNWFHASCLADDKLIKKTYDCDLCLALNLYRNGNEYFHDKKKKSALLEYQKALRLLRQRNVSPQNYLYQTVLFANIVALFELYHYEQVEPMVTHFLQNYSRHEKIEEVRFVYNRLIERKPVQNCWRDEKDAYKWLKSIPVGACILAPFAEAFEDIDKEGRFHEKANVIEKDDKAKHVTINFELFPDKSEVIPFRKAYILRPANSVNMLNKRYTKKRKRKLNQVCKDQSQKVRQYKKIKKEVAA